jgi:hypothetical protein
LGARRKAVVALQSSNVPSTCSSKSGVGLSAIIDCIGNTKIAMKERLRIARKR